MEELRNRVNELSVMEELRNRVNELSLSEMNNDDENEKRIWEIINNGKRHWEIKKRHWEMIWKAEEERRSRWINDESFREREMTRKAEEKEERRLDLLKRSDQMDELIAMEKKDKERYEEMKKEMAVRDFWDFYRCCHLLEYPPITHYISARPLRIIDNSPVESINEIQVGMLIHVRRTVQYWCPRSPHAACSVVVGTHDDDDLQIITSHPLDFNSPIETYKLYLDLVFTSNDDAEIMLSIYNQVYDQCSTILSSHKQLDDVMKSILDSIIEKKEYVLKEKPRLLDISVFINLFEHKYFQSAEDAYPIFASAGHPDNPYFIEFIGMHNERRRRHAVASTPILYPHVIPSLLNS